jgi:hypothetical protein
MGVGDRELLALSDESSEPRISVSRVQKSASLDAARRNREHARNTRLRKKAYIETLRSTVQTLTEDREKQERNSKVRWSATLQPWGTAATNTRTRFLSPTRHKTHTVGHEHCLVGYGMSLRVQRI